MKKIYCNNRDQAIKTREILEDMMTSGETRFEISDLFGLTHDFKNIKAEILDNFEFKLTKETLVFAKSSEQQYLENFKRIEFNASAFEHIQSDKIEILVLCDTDEEFSDEYESIDTDYLRCLKIKILWPKSIGETISINLSSDANSQSKVLSYINLLDTDEITENSILVTNTDDKKRVNITCYDCEISDILTGIESVAKSVGMTNIDSFLQIKRTILRWNIRLSANLRCQMLLLSARRICL